MGAAADEEFAEFMRGRWPAMVRLAYGLTGDRGHAEDVAQAAFARAYAAWFRVRRAGDPDAYVRRIVINENRKRFRRHRVTEVSAPLSPPPARPGWLVPRSACSAGSPRGAGRTPDFTGAAQSGIAFELGNVAPGVAYFVLTFADGQQLKLIPVTVSGHRYIAFAAPLDMPVASLTAHLGSAHFDNGTTQTAIPFTHPGIVPQFSAWLRPGQPALPRVTAEIGSGTVDGTSWTASAYQGPWGICLAYTGGDYCSPTALAGTGLTGWGAAPMVVAGRAAANVAYLEITMSDGTVLPKVTPVRVGEQRLFAVAVPRHAKQPGHWIAYSASGTRLSSGTFGGR